MQMVSVSFFLAVLVGMAGMISGLAVKKVRDFRRLRDILIAVAINAGFALLFSAYKYGGFDFYYINKVVIWSSVFLVVGMLLLAPVVRRPQVVEGQFSADAKPQIDQDPGFTRSSMRFYQIWLTAITNKTFLLSWKGRTLLGV